MSLFDSVGLALVGTFSSLYPDGKLHRSTETYTDDGDVTTTDRDCDIKAKVDSATEAMKTDAGYSSTDVAIYVLRDKLTLDITTDDEITAQGVRYCIGGPIRKDTAGSHFVIRGTSG